MTAALPFVLRRRCAACTLGSLAAGCFLSGAAFAWPFHQHTGGFNGDGWTANGTTAIEPLDMDRDGDTDMLSIFPSASTQRIHANKSTATSRLPQNVETGVTGLGAMATAELSPGGGRPERRHAWNGNGVRFQQQRDQVRPR